MIDHGFFNVHGLSLVGDPNMVETVQITDRVRGGYMNRWWVLKTWTVTRPASYFIRCGNHLRCHPDMFEAIKAEVEKQNHRSLVNTIQAIF